MSIVTKTGDAGETALLFNRRVSKTDARVEACGAIDELNAALGLARSTAQIPSLADRILAIQKVLIGAMGELALDSKDHSRYTENGYVQVTGEQTTLLETIAVELESRQTKFKGWVMPGENPTSAAIDFARAVCRRAERSVWTLGENSMLLNREIPRYLNRLSDVLWLLARSVENHPASESLV